MTAFWGKTLQEGVRYRLGTRPPSQQVLDMNPVKMDSVAYLPESFDSRQKWPNYIHSVRDQGDCAASWAFSTAGMCFGSIYSNLDKRTIVFHKQKAFIHFDSNIRNYCTAKEQLGGYFVSALYCSQRN